MAGAAGVQRRRLDSEKYEKARLCCYRTKACELWRGRAAKAVLDRRAAGASGPPRALPQETRED